MRRKITAFVSILSQKANKFLAEHGLEQKKISLIVLMVLVLAIPLSVIAVVNFAPFLPRATSTSVTPPTPPFPTPTPTLNQINWKTLTVSLNADDFYIIANNQKYLDNVASLSVRSDPGNATYTTLEAIWFENNREMRLFMYFNADSKNWWTYEIRTYNGQQQYPDWIYYKGRFFESPLGQPFVGNVKLVSDSGQQFSGRIYFKNLRLQAFLTQPTPTPTLAPTLTPTLTLSPTPTPVALSVSTNNVRLTLVKDYRSPSGLTMAEAFRITSTGTTTWQLKNNQDATYTSPEGKTSSVIAQGFGFYETSGGITAGQTLIIHAYVNNNKAAGTYRGSYTLQSVNQGYTQNVIQIFYNLTVSEPPTATPTPKLTVTPTPPRKLTPTPTWRPTPTPTPRPSYHTECRRQGLFKLPTCVRVSGPGVNRCRTSRDCWFR